MAIVTPVKDTYLKLDTKQASKLPPGQKRFRKANDPLKIISVDKGPDNHWVFHFSPPGLTIGPGPVLSCLAWPGDWEGVGEIFAKVQELNRVRSIGQSTPLQGPKTFKVLDRDASGKVVRCALDVVYKSQVDNALNPGGACNVTCIAMGLGYFDLAKDGAEQLEDRLYAEMEASGKSRHSPYHLQQLAIDYGMADNFAVFATMAEIKQWVEGGRPCVVHGWFTGSGHIVMIIGFDADGFVVHDPWGEWASDGYRRNDAANPQRGRYIHYSYGMIDAKCRESDGSFWCHFLDRPGWNPTQTPIAAQSEPKKYRPQEFRLNSIATAMIKSYEGLNLSAYLDSVRVPTIGIGTTVYPNGRSVRLGDTCTMAEALAFFEADMKHFMAALRGLVDVSLTGKQIAALTSFIYNTGETAFAESTILKVINASGPAADIQYQFSRWVKGDTDAPIPGLVSRRKSEAALWVGGDWQTDR